MAVSDSGYTYAQFAGFNPVTGKFQLKGNSETGVTVTDPDSDRELTQGEAFTADGIRFIYGGTATLETNNGEVTSGFIAGSGGKFYFFSKVPEKDFPQGSVEIDFDGGDTPVCFYPGTLIRTPTGEAAVETLKAGDLVLTADGRALPVRWMGRQTVSTRFGDALRVLPIRVRAGALGENLPARDLLVSPGHALLVEGVLVHASALVNGTTVVRETAVPEVFTYWHVEVADHALILAEGAPAETFVDNVDRERFDNWAEFEAIAGSQPAIAEMDLPRAKSARQVPAAIRARLAERAAATAAAA